VGGVGVSRDFLAFGRLENEFWMVFDRYELLPALLRERIVIYLFLIKVIIYTKLNMIHPSHHVNFANKSFFRVFIIKTKLGKRANG
jgi:hypothetical protein